MILRPSSCRRTLGVMQLPLRATFRGAIRCHDMHMLMDTISILEKDSSKRIFGDVEGAAGYLAESWPEKFVDTPLHISARRVACDALASLVPVEAFRQAFAAAAEEAGILAEPPSLGLTVG